MSGLILEAIGLIFDIFDSLLSFLPSAPFVIMLGKIDNIDVLGYVNYFIPFDFCAVCINLWLVCVLSYYVYKYLKKAIDNYGKRK